MVDRLTSGQSLLAGQQLVSGNGRFTLSMQTDGNLVLYADAITADDAYWSSNTYWLPEDERPVRADLQADAHFVLYDGNMHPRWASGTWGEGYVAPYLVIQDDGNLVIYHDGGKLVWASGVQGGAGAYPARGPVPYVAAPDLDTAVRSFGVLPAVVATGIQRIGDPFPSNVDVGGVNYTITHQRSEIINATVEQAYLQDLGALGVWPGALIQGRALLAGDVATIGPRPRRPGRIAITTDFISGTPRAQSADIAAPDAATVAEARRDILNKVNPTGTAGILRTSYESASTLREVGAKLSINIKGSNFGVDANAQFDEARRSSTVIAVVRQVFYNISFIPQGGGARGFWQDSVTPADIDAYAGLNNPPLYIESVQYGRFICVTVQGAFSSVEMKAALNASLTAGTTSGNVAAEARFREVLSNSQVKIYTIGVPGHGGFQDLTDPLPQLREVFRSGLSMTLQNPGEPISFIARHLADNSVAQVRIAAQYTQALSAVGDNVNDRNFVMWDGPGGGPINTGIRVNPADNVRISASGAIWSGVFGSGTHGPEGWPGHSPDAAAPISNRNEASAYSLVARVGGNALNWFEASSFWEGEPPGAPGTLQLGINDNNPYNGDSTKRWQVTIDVVRGNAQSHGIFI